MTKLKRCPFCGPAVGDPECVKGHMEGTWHVSCCECHARTADYLSMFKAIRAWNGREKEELCPVCDTIYNSHKDLCKSHHEEISVWQRAMLIAERNMNHFHFKINVHNLFLQAQKELEAEETKNGRKGE